MIKTFNLLFALIFFVLGISGWVANDHGLEFLFGIFRVDAVYNTFHVLLGAIALITGLISEHTAKIFFRCVGIVSGALAVIAFVFGEQPVFGTIASNTADAWLFTFIAASSLLLGFVVRDSSIRELSEEAG
jgi:hypothetical protein